MHIVSPPHLTGDVTGLSRMILAMIKQSVDHARLREALGALKRGPLLIIAQRAVELVPRSSLEEFLRDILSPSGFEQTASGSAPQKSLADEVRVFHEACLARKFHDEFRRMSTNYREKSAGTEAFMAEFDRLANLCVQASRKSPRGEALQAFGLLFDVLRKVDDDPDRILYFADEGGSWAVGVDWRTVLPAYFSCVAEGLAPAEFVREIDRVIEDFVDYHRPHFLKEARRLATPDQKNALSRLQNQKRE